MSSVLNGARLKIVRAQEHLNSFKAEAVMFLEQRPYRFDSQHDGDLWTLAPVITTEPPNRFSTIIGDCVTNLRAAIDYIVWEVAQDCFKPPFDITDWNDRTITVFPIAERGSAHRGHIDRLDRLTKRGVTAPIIQAIKDVQPDVSGDQSLLWLHELVNRDKHRTPLLTIGIIRTATIVMITGNVRREVSGASIKDGATFNTSTSLGKAIRDGAMKVDAQAAIDITWKSLPMPDEPVDRTLEQVIKTCADIVTKFDTLFA